LFLFAVIRFASASLNAAGRPPDVHLSAITSAIQIRRMTIEDAKLGHPVGLRAVITYYDALEPDLLFRTPRQVSG
jgi:hypothetical protein